MWLKFTSNKIMWNFKRKYYALVNRGYIVLAQRNKAFTLKALKNKLMWFKFNSNKKPPLWNWLLGSPSFFNSRFFLLIIWVRIVFFLCFNYVCNFFLLIKICMYNKSLYLLDLSNKKKNLTGSPEIISYMKGAASSSTSRSLR